MAANNQVIPIDHQHELVLTAENVPNGCDLTEILTCSHPNCTHVVHRITRFNALCNMCVSFQTDHIVIRRCANGCGNVEQERDQ